LSQKIAFSVTDHVLEAVLKADMKDLSAYIQDVKDQRSADAFYKVVQACEAKVFTMCFRIIGNREEAEEAAQDVFMSCYNRIQSLEDNDKFIQWILRIAYHKSIDYVRRKKTIYTELMNDGFHQQANYKNQNLSEDEGNFEKYISICDENEKAILLLYYQEEMSVKEISETLQISASNVKIKLFRSRNKIKKFIDKTGKKKIS
jgi:RNA polymerase sigma-70 factor (ECF subfamily)